MNLKKAIKNKIDGKQSIVNNIAVRLYNPKRSKPKPDELDASFSVDVCVIDEKGLNGLAYYCYKSKQWKFHTDMMADYNNLELNIKWWWYYPPIKISDINR